MASSGAAHSKSGGADAVASTKGGGVGSKIEGVGVRPMAALTDKFKSMMSANRKQKGQAAATRQQGDTMMASSKEGRSEQEARRKRPTRNENKETPSSSSPSAPPPATPTSAAAASTTKKRSRRRKPKDINTPPAARSANIPATASSANPPSTARSARRKRPTRNENKETPSSSSPSAPPPATPTSSAAAASTTKKRSRRRKPKDISTPPTARSANTPATARSANPPSTARSAKGSSAAKSATRSSTARSASSPSMATKVNDPARRFPEYKLVSKDAPLRSRGGLSRGGGWGTTGPKNQWLLDYLAEPRRPELEKVIYYEDELCVVIYDGFPKAKYHLLLIGKDNPVNTPADLSKEHLPCQHRLYGVGKAIADELCRQGAGQVRLGYHAIPSVAPLHMHIVSQDFDSPDLFTKKQWNGFTTDFFLDCSWVKAQLEERGMLELDDEKYLTLRYQSPRCFRCGLEADIESLKTHHHECAAPLPADATGDAAENSGGVST